MVLKLYGFPRASGATRAVLVTLLEKQVPFEHCIVDVQNGELLLPRFIAMQPFSQYPVIDDDGLIVYESRAICRYLEDKYPAQGTRLGPPSGDLRARARFEQAMSVETFNFHPHVHTVYFERINKPLRGLQSDEAAISEALQKLGKTLDVYDLILGKTRFLAGDEFTLADLFHLPFGGLLSLNGGSDIMSSEARPNVARWWNEIHARPTVQRFPQATPIASVDSY
ncbi:unnamed protein product [Mycena citricolor]|uniref:glutathione transferase n=1 Tax=Mycena citricolor TaxID=2018698 RepID=A0AAD2H4J5_9AGAR|nr:unnamed protein product [Mycena citricolor]